MDQKSSQRALGLKNNVWTVERVFLLVQDRAQEASLYAWNNRLQHRVFMCTPNARTQLVDSMLLSMRTLLPCPQFMQRATLADGRVVLGRGGYAGGWEQLVILEEPNAVAVCEFRHEMECFSRALETVVARIENRITRLPR